MQSLTTAYANTWRVPRRPLVSRIYASPINYKGTDGAWHPIGTTLVPAAMGGYENEANGFSLQIPSSLSSGVSLSGGASSVNFALQGAREPLPAVSGNRAMYPEALASTDFEYTSSSTGVQETATLLNSAAPSELRFTLTTSPGLQAVSEADGTIALIDSAGKVWASIPAPIAYSPAAGAGAGKKLESTLTRSSAGWVLAIDTGESWLRTALSSGPVAVDPSLELSGAKNCWIESDSPTTSYCTQTTFQAGYQSESPAHEHHGLLEFELPCSPCDDTVLNAKLGLYLASESTTNSKPVGVYRVEKPWTTSATWNTYDGTHSWTTGGGDYANPAEESDASINPSVGGSTGWEYWYPTKMVQEWANGPKAPEQFDGTVKEPQGDENDGLIVKDEKDNTVNNVLTFDSIRASSHQPFLEVTYEPRGLGEQGQFTVLKTQLTNQLSMGVNVASGDLLLKNQDMHIAGRGVDFTSTRSFNELDPNIRDYGRWTDSNFPQLYEYGDGSMELSNAEGYFVFLKKTSTSYVTPHGIKATLCTAGVGHAPCPVTLPGEAVKRLVYNQSKEYIDFNSFGWPTDMGDRYGNVLTSGHKEGIDTLTSWTDTEGRKIEYATQAERPNWPTELKDVSGSRHDSYEYEGSGEGAALIGYTDAVGNTTHYHYEAGNLTKVTTPAGNVILFAYDEWHRIKEITRTTNSEHTTGPTTKYIYYEVGAAPAPCTANQKATVVEDPDWKGLKPGETTKLHETTYCANVLDEVEKTVNAEGQEAKAEFDPFGNAIASTAPPGETGAGEAVTSLIYGEAGENLGCEVQTGEKAASECPPGALEKGLANEYKYKDETFPYQASEATSARQKTAMLCYWGDTCAGSEGASPKAGELQQLKDPLTSENTLKYTYNTHGQIASSTDADGHVTTYEYDTKGNVKAIVPPSGSGLDKETIEVDEDSRPHVVTQCLVESGGSCMSSETATLTYNKDDAIIEAVDTGPGATKTFKYTYNPDGNLEKRVDPSGTTTFTYDHLGRLTEEALPGSATNWYAYDAASNLESFTNAGGTTQYFYTGLNELESMYEPGGSCGEKSAMCTRASYNNDGALTKITYPSGATLNYAVDPIAGRPTAITVKNPKGEVLLSNTYSYLSGTNDTPLIFKDTYSQPGTAADTTTYEYDALDRLREATTTGTNSSYCRYTLDGAGNRTSQKVNTSEAGGGTETVFDYNAGNQLECRMKTVAACSKSAATELSGYSYNGAGGESAITGFSEAASTSFAYNDLNQVSGLTPPSTSEESVTYLGSSQGSLSGLGTTTLQNSALGLAKQVNEAGTSYYARTPGGLLVDERLPGGIDYNPIFDPQGDVIGLLSSSGALAQTIRYGPYGENTTAAGSTTYTPTNDPFLFQGGYHLAGGDAGTGNVPNGLYHFGERYFDPTTGRWTQEDALDLVGSAGQSDRYVFDADDPANETDPSGKLTGCVSAFLGIGGEVCLSIGSKGLRARAGIGAGIKISGTVSAGQIQRGGQANLSACFLVCDNVTVKEGQTSEEASASFAFGPSLTFGYGG